AGRGRKAREPHSKLHRCEAEHRRRPMRSILIPAAALALMLAACSPAEREEAGANARSAAEKVKDSAQDLANDPDVKAVGGDVKEAAGEAVGVVKDAAGDIKEGVDKAGAEIKQETGEAKADADQAANDAKR